MPLAADTPQNNTDLNTYNILCINYTYKHKNNDSNESIGVYKYHNNERETMKMPPVYNNNIDIIILLLF